MTRIAHLASRSVIAVTGPDVRAFLQGLLTQDVTGVAPGQARWAGLLSPQGKCLFTLILFDDGAGGLLLDVAADRASELVRRLMLYRLRARVEIAPRPDLAVYAAWNGQPPAAAFSAPDPRLPALGWRLLAPALEANATDADFTDWRLAHGVPETTGDVGVDSLLWLETNAVELNGVDFTKGCYVGQENTARMQHRAKLRKRLLPVCGLAAVPAAARAISAGETPAGDLRSRHGDRGLALLRLEVVTGFANLTLEGHPLVLEWPDWLESGGSGLDRPASGAPEDRKA